MRVVLAMGTTGTASIEGITAAGGSPELTYHTPSADAEIVEYGRPVLTPIVPVSPAGCPTPAVVTRAVRELVGFDLVLLDAGLRYPTAAPTVRIADPGGDVRTPEPVPAAEAVFDVAGRLGANLPDGRLVIGESIPAGTTTALGTLTALGEAYGVSSSLRENPRALKTTVVEAGLDASGLAAGDAADSPTDAVRYMGDPVLAGIAGLTVGALERGAAVTLAGGTQMIAAASLVRHAGVNDPLTLATTSFIADDRDADIERAAADLDIDLVITDPGFDQVDHTSMTHFSSGIAKEGVGMGGALALATTAGVSMSELRKRIVTVYERVVGGDGPEFDQ